MSIGTIVGGHILLLNENKHSNGSIRTYQYNFGLTVVLNLLMFVIVYLMKKPKVENIQNVAENDETVVANIEDMIQPDPSNKKWYHVLRCSNVLNTLRFMSHSQIVGVRKSMIILYSIMCIYKITFDGMSSVIFEFCEKVYLWDAASYSNVIFASKLISTSFITFASFVLVKIFEINNITLLVLGLGSVFTCQLMVGVWLKSIIFYISLPIG